MSRATDWRVRLGDAARQALAGAVHHEDIVQDPERTWRLRSDPTVDDGLAAAVRARHHQLRGGDTLKGYWP